jgi:hypothetical protein
MWVCLLVCLVIYLSVQNHILPSHILSIFIQNQITYLKKSRINIKSLKTIIYNQQFWCCIFHNQVNSLWAPKSNMFMFLFWALNINIWYTMSEPFVTLAFTISMLLIHHSCNLWDAKSLGVPDSDTMHSLVFWNLSYTNM